MGAQHRCAPFVFQEVFDSLTVMSKLFFDALSLAFFFSPPFLTFSIWRRFFKSVEFQRPRWKNTVDWVSVIAVSGLVATCIVASFTIPCDVDRYGWRCVARWRSFTRIVIWLAPVFIALAATGRKGTRVLSTVLVIAIDFDCVIVDMMA